MKRKDFKLYLKTERFYTVLEALGSIMFGINIIMTSLIEAKGSFLYSIIAGLPLLILGPVVCFDPRKGVHTMLGGIVMWGGAFLYSLICLIYYKKIILFSFLFLKVL